MPDDSGWIPPLLQRVSPTQDGCVRKLNYKHDDLLLWRAASTLLRMTYRAIAMSIVGLYSVVLLFLVYVCFTVLWICYNECRLIMFFRWRAEPMEDRTSEVPVQGEGTFPWQERPKWPRRMSSQLSLHLPTVQSMILSSLTHIDGRQRRASIQLHVDACIGCSRSCIGCSRSCIGCSRCCISCSRRLQFQSRRTPRLSTMAGVTWI